MPSERAHAALERPHKTRAEIRKSKSAVTNCSSCSTLKTIQGATAIITTSHIAQGGGASTWPEAVRTWPEAVRTWPKAVHILVVGRLGR